MHSNKTNIIQLLLRSVISLFIIHCSLFTQAQEPGWDSPAKQDSLNVRENRAVKKFQAAVDEFLITDFATFHLTANALVKTCPFLDYPALNPALGEYLKKFEEETGTTIIIRAYIDINYFNPWVASFRSTQTARKLYEIAHAKPAHAVIDIVYSPISVVKYAVSGYNVVVKDSLRTAQFNAIFSEADFQRMRDTLQALMGSTILQIDTTNFNSSIIRALEALKGEEQLVVDPGYTVIFRQGEALGCDSYKYSALRSSYKTDKSGNPIPWLSADADKTTKLKGFYEVKNKDAADQFPIQVFAEELAVGNPTIRDTTIFQNLQAAGQAREVDVKAGYKRMNRFGKEVETVAGEISLAAYELEEKKVVVVGNINQNDLESYLNAIYGQAVAKWNVTVIGDFDYDYPGELSTEKAVMSNYSSAMNAVIKAFKKQYDIEKNTYYVFLAPKMQGGTAGFMPFKGQYGFVEANTANLNRTIAHELGHGAFNLRHTFSQEGKFIATQGATDNLMDYSAGEQLFKYQWDYVHDPENIIVTWAEQEQEVMALDNNKYLISCLSETEAKKLSEQRKEKEFKVICHAGKSGEKDENFSESEDDFVYGTTIVPATASGRQLYEFFVLDWLFPGYFSVNSDATLVSLWTDDVLKKSKEIQSTYSCKEISNETLLASMKNGLILGTSLSNERSLGERFFERYKQSKTDDFYNTKEVAELINGTTKGKNYIGYLMLSVDYWLQKAKGDINKIPNDSIIGTLTNKYLQRSLPSFGIFQSPALLALVGGTQEMYLSVINYTYDANTKKYTMELLLELMDDFGAQEGDWASGYNNLDFKSLANTLSGQAIQRPLCAFWILQKQRGIKPFRTVITYKLTINGTL